MAELEISFIACSSSASHTMMISRMAAMPSPSAKMIRSITRSLVTFSLTVVDARTARCVIESSSKLSDS